MDCPEASGHLTRPAGHEARSSGLLGEFGKERGPPFLERHRPFAGLQARPTRPVLSVYVWVWWGSGSFRPVSAWLQTCFLLVS